MIVADADPESLVPQVVPTDNELKFEDEILGCCVPQVVPADA